jgi:hypothetical protein
MVTELADLVIAGTKPYSLLPEAMTVSTVRRPAPVISTGAVIEVSFGSPAEILHLPGSVSFTPVS